MSEDGAAVGTVVDERPAVKFRRQMLLQARDNSGNRATDVMDSQVDRILATSLNPDATDDDIWNADAGGTIQAKNIPGAEVRIYDIESVPSNREDIENNKGWYVSMNATLLGAPAEILRVTGLELGTDFVLQTGAELIVAKVKTFAAKGRLPVDGVITSIQTSSGNDVLKLRPVPQRVTSGKTEK